MGVVPPKHGGVGLVRLKEHLDELEQAVTAWLERQYYESAPDDRKRSMRKQALVSNLSAELPEPYRLFRICGGTTWYAGGAADQPYVMMLEFGVCRRARGRFQSQIEMTERLLKRGD